MKQHAGLTGRFCADSLTNLAGAVFHRGIIGKKSLTCAWSMPMS
jgi:hypothetical protein